MKKIIVSFLLVSVALNAFSAEAKSPRNALSFPASFVVVPVMANVPGLFGAIWKTKVALLNPTALSYSIQATLFDKSGKVKEATIIMAAGQIRNYDNFLEEVFGFVGAGTVKLDSETVTGGSDNNQFLVNAEVYTDSAQGRYSTSVDSYIYAASASDAYSLGINVSPNSRTNIGFFNDSSSPNQVLADLFDSSNVLVTTITIDLSPQSWNQVSVPNNVIGGYIKFKPTLPAYCYAVVVDNNSNDGTFVQAAEYTP